jgi:small subunit ribosomal protein S20
LPNTKSAAKAMRQAERRRLRNKPIRSAARTFVKKARLAADGGSTEEALAAVVKAQSYLDSAASKGVIHKNNAARRKSRLMKRYNQLLAQQQADEAGA